MKKRFRPEKLLSSREKQFWQPFRNLFAQKIRKFEKIFQFCPRKFPKKVPLDTSIEVLTTMLKSFRKSQMSLRSNSKKDEPKKTSMFSFLPENVVLGTQNPALKNMLFFSGRTLLVFVLRRKRMAKFINVLKEPSFFKMLRLTHINHNRLPIRSDFFGQNSGKFSPKVRKIRKKNFLRKHVFPQKVFLVALNATLEFWPDIFRKKGSNSLTKNSELTKHSWCFRRKKIPPNVLQDT